MTHNLDGGSDRPQVSVREDTVLRRGEILQNSGPLVPGRGTEIKKTNSNNH